MGASGSKNIQNITATAMAETVTEFMQNLNSESSAYQSIIVEGTEGDVVIDGNTQTTEVSINMEALQSALSTQQVQQDMSVNLAQAAKSITKDLNLFNFSSAENNVRMYMNTAVKISTDVNQKCSASAFSEQTIMVKTTSGNVTVSNNTQSTLTDIFIKCIQNSTVNSDIMQKIQADITQTASATTKGTNAVLLALVALLAFIAPIALPIIIGASTIMKLLFPLILLAGIGVLIAYFLATKHEVISNGYSPLISETDDCIARVQSSSDSIKSPQAAAQTCQDDGGCDAYDWQGMIVDKGSWTGIGPKTTFYTSVKNSPCKSVTDKEDSLDILQQRVIYLAKSSDTLGEETLYNGDVWVDSDDTAVYFWNSNDQRWETQDTRLIDDMADNKTIELLDPGNGDIVSAADYVIRYKQSNDGSLTLYTKTDGIWDIGKELLIPGKTSRTNEGKDLPINYSGFKRTIKNPILLYVGIGLTTFGAIGTMKNFVKPAKKVNDSK